MKTESTATSCSTINTATHCTFVQHCLMGNINCYSHMTNCSVAPALERRRTRVALEPEPKKEVTADQMAVATEEMKAVDGSYDEADLEAAKVERLKLACEKVEKELSVANAILADIIAVAAVVGGAKSYEFRSLFAEAIGHPLTNEQKQLCHSAYSKASNNSTTSLALIKQMLYSPTLTVQSALAESGESLQSASRSTTLRPPHAESSSVHAPEISDTEDGDSGVSHGSGDSQSQVSGRRNVQKRKREDGGDDSDEHSAKRQRL